jgi:hypothetical protein
MHVNLAFFFSPSVKFDNITDTSSRVCVLRMIKFDNEILTNLVLVRCVLRMLWAMICRIL